MKIAFCSQNVNKLLSGICYNNFTGNDFFTPAVSECESIYQLSCMTVCHLKGMIIMSKSKSYKRITASLLSFSMAAVSLTAASAGFTVTAVTDSNAAVALAAASADTLGAKDVYKGFTADVASSDMKTITFSFVPDYTGNFVCGLGIGTADSPYWYEYDSEKGFVDSKGGTVEIKSTEIAVTKGETATLTFDLSKLKLSYNPSTDQYPGKFEFRCYYAGEDNGTVTISSIEANDGSAPLVPGKPITDPTDPTDPTTPTEPGKPDYENVPSNNKKSGTWSFTDNKDGTATITSTVTKQIDNLEYVLTQGYDEDSYAAQGVTPTEDDPINSHKFTYADFGITDFEGVTIESLTAVVETPEGVSADQFMYGGGLNVASGSPADTEYAKKEAGIEGKENAGYWYNDMGEEELENFKAAGVEFGVTPGTGATIKNAGSYIECYWEVPAEVQPYAEVKADKGISFQYWYGDQAGTEEYTVLESVTLKNIAVTYTKEVTVPYTASAVKAVDTTLNLVGVDDETNALKIKYADLGVEEGKDIYAIRFDVSAPGELDKLVYSPATSVTEAAGLDYWFQETDFVVLDAKDKAEIMWIIPSTITGGGLSNYVDEAGELFLGYWYGATDTLTVDNIEVYYADEPIEPTEEPTEAPTKEPTEAPTKEPTEAPTKEPTEAPTKEPTEAPTEPPTLIEITGLWGDADFDGDVDLADAVAVVSYVADPAKYPLSAEGAYLADVSNNGDGISAADAIAIQGHLLDSSKVLPESYMK